MPPTPKKYPTLWRLLGFLGKRRAVYFASLFGVALALTSERMVTAYVIKLFVDAITKTNLGQLWRSVEVWGVFSIFWIPVTMGVMYVWKSTIVRVVAGLRERIFSHLQRLPLGYFELRHSGDLLSVMTNDVSAAETAFQEDLLNLVNASLQMVSATVFMLALQWKLALIIIAAGLIPLAINSLFAGPLRRAGEAVQARLGDVSERLSDLLAGYQVVRTFDLGEWILGTLSLLDTHSVLGTRSVPGRFGQANRDLLQSGMRRVNLEAWLDAWNYGAGISFLASLGFGSYLTIIGQSSFGTMIALVQLNNSINFFVYSLGGTITRIQSSLAAADRILEVLDVAPEPETYYSLSGNSSIRDLGSGSRIPNHVLTNHELTNPLLQFRNVSFSYDTPGNGRAILQDMSFEVCRGQVAAFVGPSGGGKSTIFKLLLGCYPVNQGQVLVAGCPIEAYRLHDLRDTFAYIPQDAYLYSGSILENIRYGKPGASQDEVIAAARSANAHDFICEFPEGYQTRVGERGARLSGGQRQRIAIARALLKDAAVLLLDEATSALDSESEELVQQALAVLMRGRGAVQAPLTPAERGRTVLVIAHRLSTIENADIIYAVEEGRVAEAGTHAELLEKKGLFYRLHELQFREE